jgi:hypothetical protein
MAIRFSVKHLSQKESIMESLAQKLRKAYDLIATADTSDIDAYYLAVEEAQGYIAEALDMADNFTNEYRS